jgi:hypothetical protein
MARANDVCNKCGHTGHWAKDCDVSFDASYKRTGKADKKKIFLDVKYRDKDFAKSHGARWDPDARKWFVWDRVPDALKEFEPIRKHAYIKPEKTIDGLCKYCFFSFEEGLRRSDSDDASACVHCAPKKQPPTCKHCNRYMVSDCWTGAIDDDSIQIIHDCVGNPMMYGGGCSLQRYGGGCRNRPGHREAFVNDCRSSGPNLNPGLFPPFNTEDFCEDIESMRTNEEKDKMYKEGDAILSKLRAQLPNEIQVREQTHNKLVLDINNPDDKHVHKVVCETLQTSKGVKFFDKWCVDQENSVEPPGHPGSRYVLTPMKCFFGKR